MCLALLGQLGCSSLLFQKEQSASARLSEFLAVSFAHTPERTSPGVAFAWLTVEGDSQRSMAARKDLQALRSIDTAFLSVDERIDWLLIEADRKRTLHDASLRTAERVPGRYLTLGSLEWSIGGERRPDEAEWRSVLHDVLNAPEAMAIGRARLKDPPERWVRLALGTIARYQAYMETAYPLLVREKAPAVMKDSLLKAGAACGQALADFGTFLTDTLRVPAGATWAIGEEAYNWLLTEYHFLPYTVEGMIAVGREIHEETRRELQRLADGTGTGLSWKELIGRMKQRHPSPGRIAEAYAAESDRARRLLTERSMIAIPPAETLLFVPTPPALRETYAWGGYGGIRMMDSVMVGRFFVTDVDSAMTTAEAEEKLRTQNDGWITVIALHEGYPGHHLQSVYARNNPKPVRARLGSTYFGEGWALYCESWMGREGFYADVWDSLGWLNMRLWRTARVILDPSLHSGRMTYEEAVTFFMDEVGLERSAAEAEVNRYTTWPTQAPSYIIGWLELERLKAALRERYGEIVTDRAFAESVLRSGSLPPALLRRALGAEWEYTNTTHVLRR